MTVYKRRPVSCAKVRTMMHGGTVGVGQMGHGPSKKTGRVGHNATGHRSVYLIFFRM